MAKRDYKQAYALAKFVIIAIPTNTEKIQKKYKDKIIFFTIIFTRIEGFVR